MKTKRKLVKRAISAATAERQTKRAALKRRVVIELTDQQLKAFKKLKPTEAAELVFTVRKRPTSLLKIAGYSYHGDTCCV